MTIVIPLSKDREAIIDDADYELVGFQNWFFSPRKGAIGYAYFQDGRNTIYMHRWIVDAPPGFLVDHINGNGLDNRRSNLRLCSVGENTIHKVSYSPRGRSKYIGVELFPKGRWNAYCYIDHKHVRLGSFDTEEEAAKARDMAVYARYGKFATLNFPMEGL